MGCFIMYVHNTSIRYQGFIFKRCYIDYLQRYKLYLAGICHLLKYEPNSKALTRHVCCSRS